MLDPLQITNLPRGILGASIASLLEYGDRIANALDVMLSRAWRRQS